MAYIIVIFEEENTVEAVPSDWYKNGKCIWPKKSIEARRLIEQKANPLHFEHTTFNARKLSGEILSLSEAKTKAIKATDTSDLSSIDEKATRKIRHSYHNGHAAKQVTTKITISPPHFSADEDSSSSINSIFGKQDTGMQIDSSQTNISSIFHGSQTIIEPEKSTFAPRVDDINNKDNAAITTILETQSTILRTVLNMKHSIHDLSSKLNFIENTQMEICENLKNDKIQVSNVSELTNYNFPIKTEEELQEFELKLSELPFKMRLVDELTRLARGSVGDTVRQILSKLFHNTLLSTYSYIGQKKKKPFQSLNANNVIFETIRKIKKFEKTNTDLEIEAPIKQYLAGAKFREQKKINKS